MGKQLGRSLMGLGGLSSSASPDLQRFFFSLNVPNFLVKVFPVCEFREFEMEPTFSSTKLSVHYFT